MESKMIDCISREAAINAVFEAFADGRSVYIALETLPVADVRPVVTCGECKHRHDKNRQGCQGRREDWFCADGERRELG